MELITGKWKNSYDLHTIFYHDRLEKYMYILFVSNCNNAAFLFAIWLRMCFLEYHIHDHVSKVYK